MTQPVPDLTKAQMDVFDYLVENYTEFSFTAHELSKQIPRSRATISRALEKLHDSGFLSAKDRANPAGGIARHYAIRRPPSAPRLPIDDFSDESDKTIVINVNSPGAITTIGAFNRLQDAVRGSNAYAKEDPEGCAQTLAELEAGETVVKSGRVRTLWLAAILGTLTYLAKKFSDHVIGNLTNELIDKLRELTGP